MDWIKFTLRPDHWVQAEERRGKGFIAYNCPMALAATEAYPFLHISVGDNYVIVDHNVYPLTSAGYFAVFAFDHKQPMPKDLPKTFILRLKQHM